MNIKFWSTQLSDAQRTVQWGFSAGLDDVRANLPFRDAYDRNPSTWQIAYEHGRLAAHNLRSAGMAIPVWDGGRKQAPMIERLVSEAARQVGAAFPLAAA